MFLQFSQELSPNTVKNRLNASKCTLYQQNDVSSWLSGRQRQFALLLLIQESQVRSSCETNLFAVPLLLHSEHSSVWMRIPTAAHLCVGKENGNFLKEPFPHAICYFS